MQKSERTPFREVFDALNELDAVTGASIAAFKKAGFAA